MHCESDGKKNIKSNFGFDGQNGTKKQTRKAKTVRNQKQFQLHLRVRQFPRDRDKGKGKGKYKGNEQGKGVRPW